MDLNTTGQEVHLSHYWNIIYKRWKVALSILIVVMVGTFLASYFSKPLYRSVITIQIERENPNQLTVEDLFGIAASDQEFLQTQYVLLKSRGLAARVIDDHKLLSDPEFYPGGIAGKSKEDIAKIRDGMIDTILAPLDVTPVRNTSLVEVAYVAPSPRLAQKIAEGVGDSYMSMNLEQKLESVKEASEFLSRQIAQLHREIDVTRGELQKYGESKDIVSVGGADNITVQKLSKLNEEFTNVQSQAIQKQGAYAAIVRASPETVVANDPLVAQMNEEETRLQRDYNQKLATFRPEYPDMVKLKGMIERTRQAKANAIQESYGRARERARNEMVQADAQVSSMRVAFEEQKREAMKLNANANGYTDLRTVVDSKQTLLDQLTKRQNETEVTARLRGSANSNIRWVDHAQLPTARFNVTMKRNLQSAFPLGVILGLAAIFFLEYMDRSIKSPEELERVTGFASLGVIPSAHSLTRGYGYGYGAYGNTPTKLRAIEESNALQHGIDLLPHVDSRSPISEAYRAFRTSLLLASANSPKVIVITSTFAREGKTTTSVNLAVVLAQMGKPVLLIDADLRRPRLQKVFRGKMNLGLVNYLAANIPLEDVIQETVVPHLSVVLSGPTPPNPSELLASDRMKHLIHDIRSKFAYVIFDSPPVLAVTDSIVLAASADGVVLCVHGGQTPRDLVQRSSERLRQSNIPVLGAILNNLDLQQYGYTFRKSYYDYYDSDEPGDGEGEKKAALR
ncbi:MAG: polysaccharide biosynthesis transport protein [Acidobacteriota bacterium]|jgi:capsular exopolysaccharide synthesis family protein|nr:polysaccharide biosynthesis transport protein [Acidobacteriota bacterium]